MRTRGAQARGGARRRPRPGGTGCARRRRTISLAEVAELDPLLNVGRVCRVLEVEAAVLRVGVVCAGAGGRRRASEAEARR